MPRAVADPQLAATIKRMREKAGLSQERLAQGAGLSLGAISRIEREEQAASWATVVAIARALGITVAELARQVEEG
jgi:transcriptional regulator with XRE-family HTH domain